ncbi:T9SS type A sorting domain-containing protein [Aegicerativicinus sediminis]
MKRLDIKLSLVIISSFLLMSWVAKKTYYYYVPTGIDDFFMPGSQPLESGVFDSPNQCDNCHGGYDNATEPAFNWRGSMMAHSMRDPLFQASLSIANQDALDSGDLCLRCHTPTGWLENRSTPTDGSALIKNDLDGVQCHFCHKLIDPLSNRPEDLNYLNTINNIPTVYGNGMFVADSDNNSKRGPFDDASANHPTIYSSFHSESEMCATCHDVSNPAFTKTPNGSYKPNDLNTPSDTFETYEMFPIERTYSEWKMSAYNSPNGIPSTAFGGNKQNVRSCQDCHMQDVSGYGCNKSFAPFRSNLPLHDLTGGNTFVPLLVKSLYPNDVDHAAIDAGIIRAEYMLKNAATMNLNVEKSESGYDVEVNIINETGHKLPSGYPEGRRMWINLQAFDINNNLLYESGSYDTSSAQLQLEGTKIYEAKLGMDEEITNIANANGNGNYTSGESFHFVLNNTVVKDNRIPPRGFTNVGFESVQAAPVGYSYEDGEYYDQTDYQVPEESYKILVKLYYQTVSKEYIEFLRDNNTTNNTGQQIYDLWTAFGKSTPVIMQEKEFYTDVLSISDNEAHNNLTVKLYPNPTQELIHIKVTNNLDQIKGYEITDINGKKIKTQLIPKSQTEIAIETKGISSGLYFIKINLTNTSIIKQFLIR